jgi:hypothetical protein
VFRNRVLRIGPKTQEVAEEWGKLHIDELSDLYSSQNVIRTNK